MIMNRLETDTFDCEKIDDFDPESMLKRAKRSGIKYACLLLFFSHLVLGLGYIPVMSLACWYYFNNLQISNVQTFKTLPYYTHIPVDHDTPLKYIFACLLQCVPMYLYVNAFVGVDSLFMNLMNFIATRMLILQGAFRTMRKRCLKKIIGNDLTPDNLHNSDEMEEYMMSDMKKCIQHLQLLLRSCKDIEDNFQYVSLVQALGTIYILCSTLLLLSTSQPFTKEFGRNIFYLLGVIVQLGLYCWFGNQLTLKAANVPIAVWESQWLETRKPYKVCMLLTMMRMKRPLLINAGKFVPLILETQIAVRIYLLGPFDLYTHFPQK
ncbi:7tm Odorant receptor [Popillia japonica]|uniref:7tm Odorant receptor n=1 Tax=Popillia japonica TaxID=7064 RepID=A0AAW1LWN2_POPJA